MSKQHEEMDFWYPLEFIQYWQLLVANSNGKCALAFERLLTYWNHGIPVPGYGAKAEWEKVMDRPTPRGWSYPALRSLCNYNADWGTTDAEVGVHIRFRNGSILSPASPDAVRGWSSNFHFIDDYFPECPYPKRSWIKRLAMWWRRRVGEKGPTA